MLMVLMALQSADPALLVRENNKTHGPGGPQHSKRYVAAEDPEYAMIV